MNLTSGFGKLALVAAAVLVLALGGCGRKSRLDLPPEASAQGTTGQSEAAPAQPRGPAGIFDSEEEERLSPAQKRKRRIILDPILD